MGGGRDRELAAEFGGDMGDGRVEGAEAGGICGIEGRSELGRLCEGVFDGAVYDFDALEAAEGLDCGLRAAFDAGGEGEGCDEATDAEDDAEGSEGGTEFVGEELAECGIEGDEECHCVARLAGDFSWSFPSRMWRQRWQRAAISGEWVTMRMVWPWELRERRRSRTALPVFESRLPVGSSARRRGGELARARAMATRWAWPPLSWEGR